MEQGTLKENEYHPSADSAMQYIKQLMVSNPTDWIVIHESIASTALSGNRLSEILLSTIERLNNGLPVSDRYLLGLAWFLATKQDKLTPLQSHVELTRS